MLVLSWCQLLSHEGSLSYMSSPTQLDEDGGVQGLALGHGHGHGGAAGADDHEDAAGLGLGSGGVVGAVKAKGTPSRHPRLLSLDCFRGLVIAWMIVSDEAGDAWTSWIDHAPWDGIHFADFVFPAFVFIVGMAVPLSTHKLMADRWAATRKALWRAIKMFTVGWVCASGGFPAAYALNRTRIPGILQRIAFCYLVTVLIHVWVPVRAVDSALRHGHGYARSMLRLYNKYLYQWLVAALLLATYLALTFGTEVPGCGRGHLDPECNATGYWDRTIIGLQHMYRYPTLQRLPECSSNSPADVPIPGRPGWCDRPFDPEGIVGTFTACVTGFFGLFFGHILANETSHLMRLRHWAAIAVVAMSAGLALHFGGAIPINKNLWSISYVLVMVAVDAVVFSAFYWVVDMRGLKRPLFPLIAMGSNAILVFVLAQTSISLDTALQWVYLDTPDQNLYTWFRVRFLQRYCGDSWGIFLWAMTKVVAWLGISSALYKLKIFWKL